VGGAKQKLPLADFEIRPSLHKVWRHNLITGSRQSFRKVGYSLCSVRRNSLPVRPSAATSEKVGSSSRVSREITDWSSVCPAVLRGQHQLRVEHKQLQVVNVCATGLTEPLTLAKAEGHCQSSKCLARDRRRSQEVALNVTLTIWDSSLENWCRPKCQEFLLSSASADLGERPQ